MAILVVVALGGSLGSVARYLLAGTVQARSGRRFPLGTLAVNLAGAFLLGLLLPALGGMSGMGAVAGGEALSAAGPGPLAGGMGSTGPAAAFLVTGVLGSFTTFSSFAFEVRGLTRGGRPGAAAGYALGTLVAGPLLVLAGLHLAGLLPHG